jgi:hypothetical protein
MYYYFAPYEQDFRAWWDSKTFPETSPLTRDFLQHITRPDAPRKLYSGLFVFLKLKLMIPLQDYTRISLQALAAFSLLTLSVRTNV